MQIVIDNILTNYQMLGDKKQTLLILHGWQRSLSEWLPIAKQLSKQYKVILLDLPGFGQTSRPQKTYSIYDYATFVENFLSKLEIHKVTIIGHSFGGRLGIILSAKTQLVEKLILVDSAAVETKSTGVKLKIVINKIAILPVKLFFPNSVESLKSKFGSDDYQNSGNMRDIFIQTVNADLTPLLKDVQAETLVIWGEKDAIRPMSEGRFIQQSIPHAQFRIVWGAGHSPYIEKQKEFMSILEDFVC